MYKLILFILGLSLIALNAIAQLTEPYVRKKIQPNFFIPEGALVGSKPEKVGMPIYKQGQSTAKHISARMPEEQISTQQDENFSPRPETLTDNAQTQEISTNLPQTYAETDNNSSQSTYETKNDTPQYQQMYQDYLKDLNSIVQTGSANTSHIDKDLNQMNSEKRIQIDKEFNAQRHVQEDILNALKN